MADHASLRTATTYLNNLLLARGLLRNGDPIDFVKPSKESRAQIINLVHDLILREDRDRDQREHVATTIRGLRAEDKRKENEIERLRTKCEEQSRAAVQAQAGDRSARDEVKRVEKAMKSLQEQTGKLKMQLAQVRTQCQNDVKKRDLELARLKTHLQGQQRGNKTAVAAPSINITGGSGARRHDAAKDLGDPEYSLRQETTEFLTQLSQSLSDENDGLITLVRGALTTIRELLGLPANQKHPDSAIGSTISHEDAKTSGNMMHALPTSYDTLAADLESTLEQLKNILTNPNFVSLQEVEERDEEIARLREGWMRMEHRWRDVLLMMEGWRRKMDTGHTINLDDLRHGMGLVSPDRLPQNGKANAEDRNEPEQSFVNGDSISEIQIPGQEDGADSSAILEPPRLSSPAKPKSSQSKRKRDALEPPDFFDLRPSGGKSVPASPERVSEGEEAFIELATDSEPVEYSGEPEDNSFQQMTIAEKLDLAREEAEAAAARKALATAASSKGSKIPLKATSGNSKASRSIRPPEGLDGAADEMPEAENAGIVGGVGEVGGEERDDDTLGQMMPLPSPMAKKSKIRGRPRKKRKSTLSPEELEELMVGALE